MTFNVDGTMNDITEKAPHIVNIILRYSPDVIFLSEISDKNKPILDSILFNKYPYTTSSKREFHCIYSIYPVDNWKRLDNKKNIEHLGAFACVIPVLGDSIVFYGCHLVSNNFTSDNIYITPDSIRNHDDILTYIYDVKRANKIRSKEAKAVSEEIKKSNHPIVLMGDLNDVCGSAAVRTLEHAGLKDAWWTGGFGYGATIHSPLPYRIDHIMYSKELKLQHIEVISSEVLSDHDALYAEFELCN